MCCRAPGGRVGGLGNRSALRAKIAISSCVPANVSNGSIPRKVGAIAGCTEGCRGSSALSAVLSLPDDRGAPFPFPLAARRPRGEARRPGGGRSWDRPRGQKVSSLSCWKRQERAVSAFETARKLRRRPKDTARSWARHTIGNCKFSRLNFRNDILDVCKRRFRQL